MSVIRIAEQCVSMLVTPANRECHCPCWVAAKMIVSLPLLERSIEVTREGDPDVEGESAERTSPIQSASRTT